MLPFAIVEIEQTLRGNPVARDDLVQRIEEAGLVVAAGIEPPARRKAAVQNTKASAAANSADRNWSPTNRVRNRRKGSSAQRTGKASATAPASAVRPASPRTDRPSDRSCRVKESGRAL